METFRVVAKTVANISQPFVTAPQLTGLDWYEAQAKWNVLDRDRRAGKLPHVEYLVVRSEDDADPRWADAPINVGPFVYGRQRGFQNTSEGFTAALRKWGKAHGYKGRGGGWIDAPGGWQFQGWSLLEGYERRQAPIAFYGARYYVNDLDDIRFTAELLSILPKTEATQ